MKVIKITRPLLILIILLLISCSIKYVPIPAEDIIISENFAIYKTEKYTLAIENRYWIKEPQELTDYFTTFFITIKNRTSKIMKIDPSEIGLLDENGNQFDIVKIGYIEKILLPKQIEYLMLSNLENDVFNTDITEKSILDELLDDQEEYLENWRNSKRNLMKYSFHFGKILPGAQKSGFIYFPKLDSANKRCQIIYKNKNIGFKRNDKE